MINYKTRSKPNSTKPLGFTVEYTKERRCQPGYSISWNKDVKSLEVLKCPLPYKIIFICLHVLYT